MIEFRTTDLDKRDKIINSALAEFSMNSFDKASTNNIVKDANVSKGLLYHYFKSKKELYEFLREFVFKTITEKIVNELNWSEPDFFKRIEQITFIKINITNQYPKIYDFAMKLIRDSSLEEIKKLGEKYSLDLLQKVYFENIDFTLFKDDVDVQKAMQVIQWTFEKYAEMISVRETMDTEVVMKEVESYIDLLKGSFYKEGGIL
ncbi:MAG: TetR/AcrR family transcriptional regulator [Clostridiales bacterium]|nr:TetR/AcrR family transcriptional regulator [Clostridiales bacterium]